MKAESIIEGAFGVLGEIGRLMDTHQEYVLFGMLQKMLEGQSAEDATSLKKAFADYFKEDCKNSPMFDEEAEDRIELIEELRSYGLNIEQDL